MRSVYSVGQVNAYIKNMFEQDFLLNRIYVKGEVSNCKYHTSGHIYFSLKDEAGAIACVMFAGQRKGLAFSMKNGDKVIVGGSVSVYERSGSYQLYAKEITLEGAGLLYERFLALKQELEEMGMFAPEYKQPIPSYVRTVGVVTAPTGAAIQDIRNITHRRNPFVQVILCPALVQGEGAAQSIVRAIETLDRAGVDVMIVGRGGGSMEDLWAFNEEIVARAIFNCSTPVISAVGHETDFTIADFVADLRAPTPSAAAELAVYDYYSFREQLFGYQNRLERGMRERLAWSRIRMDGYQKLFARVSPESQILQKRQYLAELEEKFQRGMEGRLEAARHRLGVCAARMDGMSPLKKLQQGYSYVADEKGHAIRQISQVQEGDALRIHVTDGLVKASVTGIEALSYGFGGNDK